MKTQIGEIAYNPALGAFEALVTFHTRVGPQRVPASFRAPLTAGFETVSRGLYQTALNALDRPGAMQSRISALPRPMIGPNWSEPPLQAA